MSTPHSTRFEELLPAYALGALDGDDLRELEEHLAGGCEECRGQLALWEGDLETLAASIAPVEPSEITRSRVLKLAGGAASAPSTAAAPAVSPDRVPAPARTPAWLGIAALLLLGLAVWGLVGQARMAREVRRLAEERDGLSRQVAALSQEVSRIRTESQRAELALQVLAAPGVQSVALAGLEAAPGAAGRTYVNPRSRDALFYAFGLPALPADKTYELWFIAGGKPVPAGTFAVDPRGTGSLRVDRVVDPGQIQAWAVTVEPRGGVPQPTGAMVLKS
jgi:anti-sigma-K factor RskA